MYLFKFTKKTPKKFVKSVKVGNKDTRATSIALLCCFDC